MHFCVHRHRRAYLHSDTHSDTCGHACVHDTHTSCVQMWMPSHTTPAASPAQTWAAACFSPSLRARHPPDHCPLFCSFQRELQQCDTDDDVAMCFIKNQAAFEKYLEFLVGRVQAESAVVSTAVQEFYKVPPSPCLIVF